MKLCCTYSPSHQFYFDTYLEPSLRALCEFELRVFQDKRQPCNSGEFRSPGWAQAVGNKAEFWRDCIEAFDGQVILCVDVDVQFFKPVKSYLIEALGDRDIVFQNSKSSRHQQRPCCTGFMVMRCNHRTYTMWHRIAERCKTNQAPDDQAEANRYLTRKNLHQLAWGTLDPDVIWCPGAYDSIEQVLPPSALRVHHANHIVGVAGKIEQLEHVKALMQ